MKKSGYREILLSFKGRIYYKNTHRIVFESFAGTIPYGYHINHINGDHNDNRLENLECLTPEANQEHSKKNLVRRGIMVNTAKLDDTKVKEIRKLKSEGLSSVKLSKKYGVHKTQINRILSGKRWSHVR